jgi:hypothetical protein
MSLLILYFVVTDNNLISGDRLLAHTGNLQRQLFKLPLMTFLDDATATTFIYDNLIINDNFVTNDRLSCSDN